MDERVIELEVKVAFQERSLAELDEVVRALRTQVDSLQGDVERLVEHLQVQTQTTVDERPPHY